MKTPLEFVVSAVRATGATVVNAQPLVQAMRKLGMPLYGCQPPTGYSMTADAWVNTGALLNRMNFAVQLVAAAGHARQRPRQVGQPGSRVRRRTRRTAGQPGAPAGQLPPDQRPRPNQPQDGSAADRPAQLARMPLQVDLASLAPDTSEATREQLIQTILAGQVADTTRQTLARAESAAAARGAGAGIAGISEAVDVQAWMPSVAVAECKDEALIGLTGALVMMTRRIFLKNGSLALVSLGFAPAFIARDRAGGPDAQEDARRDLSARRRRRPEHDRAVRRAGVLPEPAVDRDSQARTQRDGAIDLDGFFGLHPRMASLEPLFKRGELAIVHACGSHDETRSHFDAQDYMESGTPGVKSTRDGWLNRYLHAKEHENASPFRAVALAPQLPRTLQGTAPALAIGQLGAVRRARRHGDRHDVDVVRGAVRAGRRLAAAADRQGSLRRRQDAEGRRSRRATRRPTAREYPRSGFGEAMRQIAQLIKADLGLEVAFTETRQLGPPRQRRQRRPGRSPTGSTTSRAASPRSRSDLGDRMADVVVVTMSEFGRTVKENGNRGTDHGHGNAMLDPRRQRQGRQGLRQVAGPRARAALAGPRPGDHDRLPRRLRRSRHATTSAPRTSRRSSRATPTRSRSASSRSA